MFVSWRPTRPPTCTEHGDLAEVPMSYREGWLRMMDHLREAHSEFYATIPPDKAAELRSEAA